MIDWPDDIVSDIARRRCVLYLGSGVSANSTTIDGTKHPPTWDAFLREILSNKACELNGSVTTIEGLLDKKEYLTACEIIVDKLTEQVFGNLAAEAFRRPGYLPSEIHNVIFGLDSKLVITPNIDKIYDQCTSINSHGTVVTKKYYEDIAPFLRQPDYLVIKAHGCVDDPQNLVFTHKQYNLARNKYATFYRLLDALLLTNTFIFIGCGLNDPDIQLMLEDCNFSFPNCKPHYFITAKDSVSDDIARTLFANRNIKILSYDNSDGTHAELLDDLKKLSPLVEAKREELAQNASW